MTLADLIAAYRIDADDRSVPYLVDDDNLIQFLNEGEQEACIRAGLIFDNCSARCEYQVAVGSPVVALDALITNISYASLVDSGGKVYPIEPTDRIEMDRLRPNWRTDVRRPDGYIHDDKSLTLNSPVDADYTLRLELYRLPAKAMERDEDSPEIAAAHHRHLVDWALFRAYSIPDAEIFNPQKAADAEARFEQYFGKRQTASVRRKQNANRPHHNKPCW